MNIERTRASRKAARRYNVSPVARAVRSVLTLSAAALMFSGSGVVLAKSPVIAPLPVERASLSHEFAKVADLTRVSDEWTPKSVVDEEFQSFAAPMGIAQMLTAPHGQVESLGVVADPTVLPGSFHSGPGGVNGADDALIWNFSNVADGFNGGFGGSASLVSNTGIAELAFISSAGSMTVQNFGDFTLTGETWAAGFEMEAGGDITFVNSGTLVANANGIDSIAFGAYAVADGGVSMTNDGAMTANGVGDASTAFGLYAVGFGGDTSTTNTGAINATGSGVGADATGMYAASLYGDASGNNTNAITVASNGGNAIGANAFSIYGDATQTNTGTLVVSGFNATGLYAYAYYGDALVDNTGTLKVDGTDTAQGGWAKSAYGNATVDNGATGVVNVNGTYGAAALIAGASYGTASVTNAGSASANSDLGVARGVFAYGDTVLVDNTATGTVSATGYAQAIGIDAEGTRGTTVTNDGTVTSASNGDAFGVWATSYGDTRVVNGATGNVDVNAVNGIAYGIYAGGYDAYVRNFATVDATSIYGDAIGMGVGGVYAFAQNDGTINASGATAGIGMFGYGVASVNLDNVGTINAVATGTEGFAAGILAVGDTAGSFNDGSVSAVGAFATGIDIRATSDGLVENDNQVIVRGGDVTGISVRATGESGTANVLNYGVVDSQGDLFAVGVQAVARGYLGTASVLNVGNVYTAAKYGSAQGIVASADMDASVDNEGRLITVGGDHAYGILALSADGDVTVDNGYLIATVAQNRGYGIAYGIAAQSNNGLVSITNDGGMITVGENTAMGIYASTKWNDVEVTNNGMLESDAKYGAATGVIAITYTGNANVTNGIDATATVNGAYSAGGLRAISLYGDANVVNDGEVHTTGGVLDRGLTARSLYGGTATITNNGIITTDGGYSSYGVWARSDYGDATVHNTNAITSTSEYGVAYGALAGGAYTISLDNSGEIRAYAGDTAAGAVAYSLAGDATIVNSNYLLGAADNKAYGAQVIANAGTATLTNTASGRIYASGYNVADAIFASGAVVKVTNNGTLEADADGWAAGIEAVGGDITLISNTGADISAYAFSGRATGMFANGAGDVTVRNGGALDAESYSGDAFGTFAQAGGNAVLTNGGVLTATSEQGVAFGMVGIGYNADLSQSKTITVSGYDRAIGIDGDGYAHANIVNNGTVNATSVSGIAAGLYTYSVHDTRQVNNGDIHVHADSGRAFGMYAYAYDQTELSNFKNRSINASVGNGNAYGMFGYGEDALLGNAGAITVSSGNGAAIGMLAVGYATSTVSNGTTGTIDAHGTAAFGVISNGDIATATNAGHISVTGLQVAAAMQGIGMYDASTVSLTNLATGSLYATVSTKYGTAAGIVGAADGDVHIDNRGGTVDARNGHVTYGVQGHSDSGNVSVANSGHITSYAGIFDGRGFGIDASAYGDVLVDSTGSIIATGKYATGISAVAEVGDVTVGNGGSIAVTTPMRQGLGIYANSGAGIVTVTNTGTITVDGMSTDSMVMGIVAGSDDASAAIHTLAGSSVTTTAELGVAGGLYAFGPDVTIDNGGDVLVTGGYSAIGIGFGANHATIVNSGSITVAQIGVEADPAPQPLAAAAPAPTSGMGIGGYVDEGDWAIVTNDGTIDVTAIDNAFGIQLGGHGALTVNGVGAITAKADTLAIGVGLASTVDATLDNGGDIYAVAYNGAAIGASVYSDGGIASVDNSGSITAHAAGATIGVLVGGTNATVTNSGLIGAVHADYAIALDLRADTNTVNNIGHIVAQSTEEGSIAIHGGDGLDLITNSADITGALVTGAGNDRLTNAAGGTWTVRGHVTDFGDGDDSIVNAGTIVLHDAAISLGTNGSAGNSFNNTGVLSIAGSSAINMGTGAVMTALSGNNAPMTSLNALAFTNNGTISFLDGAPDDTLTITGDFAGEGALAVDVSLLHGTSDMLYVDGNVTSNTVQSLNVNVLDLMASDATEVDIPVVKVTGAASKDNVKAGTFIAGNVNFSQSNFLDLKIAVNPHFNAQDGSVDTFSLALAFGGLNDTGAIATAIAPGAQSLMSAQVGTFRQRMGVFSQLSDSDKGAWVRVFGDKGTITPDAQLDNLPVTNNFAFDQTNQGIEAGVNALVTDGVYVGASLSTSNGKQDLNNGFGSNDIDGTTVGAYVTWLGQNGMYADISYRWMHFEADMKSFGGQRDVGGDAGAFNAELGWNVWSSAGGMKLVPQVQYTRTKVENIDRISGDLADFVSDGSTSSRARLGLEMEQTFQSASGTKWTPYGVLSVVREFDGESAFIVGDTFTGRTSTEGTSGQVEFGVNAKIGQRVDVWGGLNYMDGGAIDGVWGGQLGVRYTW